MKPTTTVETMGSVWLIDEDQMTYLRMPKREGPRENGWGDADQGDLADLVWHPFTEWEIRDVLGQECLLIRTQSPGGGVIAPDAVIRLADQFPRGKR